MRGLGACELGGAFLNRLGLLEKVAFEQGLEEKEGTNQVNRWGEAFQGEGPGSTKSHSRMVDMARNKNFQWVETSTVLEKETHVTPVY